MSGAEERVRGVMPDESPIDLDEHAHNIAEVVRRAHSLPLPTAKGCGRDLVAESQEMARRQARSRKHTDS